MSKMTSKVEKAKEISIKLLKEKNITSPDYAITGKDLFANIKNYQEEYDIAYGTFTSSLSHLYREGQLKKGRKGGYYLVESYLPQSLKEEKKLAQKSNLFLLNHAYEEAAQKRLCEILSKEDLLDLVSDTKIIRVINHRKVHELEKTNSANKEEICSYLIKTFGRDLFFSSINTKNEDSEIGKKLRDKIIKNLGLTKFENKNLIRGRESSIHFILESGLPLEFAGEINTDERLPNIMVTGIPTLRKLEEYQESCKQKISEALLNNNLNKKGILCLPTGAGKTRVMVESIWDWTNRTVQKNNQLRDCNFVVWIAQSDELCEQAVQQFSDVWASKEEIKPANIFRFWGTFDSNNMFYTDLYGAVRAEVSTVIMVTTYQKIHNFLKEIHEETKILKTHAKQMFENLDLIVIDEAHYAGAESYPQIIANINILRSKNVNTIGMTATPFRHSTEPEKEVSKLQDFFGNLIFPNGDLRSNGASKIYANLQNILQEEKVLAYEKHILVETDIAVNGHVNLDDSNLPKLVADQIDDKGTYHLRQEKAAETILAIIAKNPFASVLYFGLDKEDAFYVNSRLLLRGVQSGYISGDTGKCQRQNLIKKFKDGELNVLSNCQLLTTGFDAPKVTDIVIGRPIVSPVLFTQIIGRGLRGPKFGGTEICNIHIMRDKFDAELTKKLAASTYIEMWDSKKKAS